MREMYTIEELKQTMRDAKGDTARMADMLGVSRRTVQRWIKNIANADERGLQESGGVVSAPDKRRRILPGNRFVFTTAQNNTKVHMPFFKALRRFCDERAALMLVSKQTYNKNGFQNLGKEDDELYYDEVLAPYFHCESAWVVQSENRSLVWCGELDILPTAIRPLSGLSTYTREASGIVPHVKMALESVATTADAPCKMLYTTGAVTLRNYIQRKTGQKADFHHVYGALYVEVADDGTWFARQLVAAEDGSFYDLDTFYCENSVVHGVRPAAVTLGDIHAPREDPEAMAVTLDMLEDLRPQSVILHDLVDFGTRSHWNIASPHHLMYSQQRQSVQAEFDAARRVIASVQEAVKNDADVVVAASNHVEHMRKWLETADYKKDPANAVFFLQKQLEVYTWLADGSTPEDAFWGMLANELRYGGTSEHRARLRLDTDRVLVLAPYENYRVNGVELGMHGHLGPCGARGNAKNLSRINVKASIGHTHAACIHDGVYSAGTSSKLDMGYNRGPSNWSHSHVLQYPNGKRAIVTIMNGKYKVGK